MTEPNLDTSDPEPPQPYDVPADRPNVLTFPLVIFIVFGVIGYVTDRAFPNDLGTPNINHTIGGAFISISVLLVAWAVVRFIQAGTHVDVRKPAIVLVTDGPYGRSRNPMYLAMTLLYAGLAIMLSLPIMLAFLIPCLALLHHGIIRHEETYLDRKFGNDYRKYKTRVRRWL